MAKIYIDPGHNYSGADTGAVGFGLKEQDVSVQIGLILRDMLISSGQTVKMSRENITDTISQSLSGSLAARYNGANSWGADLFISIHCNAANTKAYGCETYYCTGSSSGAELARAVQNHLLAETGRYNRGVKAANFAVIKYTNMPAILVETAFIDNYDDNQFLASEGGKNACAVAIFKGICDYLGIGYDEKITESEDIDMTKYEELKAKNEAQDEIINKIGQEIADINAKIKEEPVYDYIDDNMPGWAKPSVEKAVKKGIVIGVGDGRLGLTETDLKCIVREDRAGIYGE